MIYLDEHIDYIYLQEDVQSLIKRLTTKNVEKLISMISSKNVNGAAKLYQSLNLPIFQFRDVVLYSKKHIDGFKNKYQFHFRKVKGNNVETKSIAALILTVTNFINDKVKNAAKGNTELLKRIKFIDNLLRKLAIFLYDVGKFALKWGIVVKILALVGNYFSHILIHYPELYGIYSMVTMINPYMWIVIVAGLIMMLIGFLLYKYVTIKEKKEEDVAAYEPKDNPYDEYEV
jgi:hypothetical protein